MKQSNITLDASRIDNPRESKESYVENTAFQAIILLKAENTAKRLGEITARGCRIMMKSESFLNVPASFPLINLLARTSKPGKTRAGVVKLFGVDTATLKTALSKTACKLGAKKLRKYFF